MKAEPMSHVIENIVHNVTAITNYVTDHAYYPIQVGIANYLVNEYSSALLLTLFFGGCAAIIGATNVFVRKTHPHLPGAEKAAIWWFVISGAIHLFFEGYFSLNHSKMGPAQDLFGQLWKEYAFSDSRYLTSDPFVLCMETITAFTWGPMCFIVAAFITNSHPLRHPLQIIICVGQIYGLILYYGTSMFDHYYNDIAYSRPEAWYFWFYYFFMNFIWMVFPGMLLVSSVSTIARNFRKLDLLEAKLKENASYANGYAKTSNHNTTIEQEKKDL